MVIFRSYDAEYLELTEYLTQNWGMKALYSSAFLNVYKKSIGKMLSDGKKHSAQLRDSSSPEVSLAAIANVGLDEAFTLVGQAYRAYMDDLRWGKHVGTVVEKAIWAILVNRSDLVRKLDPAFGNYVDENHNEEFPNLLDEAFDR